MYKHHAALLEDEIAALQLTQLRNARERVRGLVQMNDELATGKAIAETALKRCSTISLSRTTKARNRWASSES
jgi:hypothetical protein